MNYGERLRSARKAKKYSQEKLAEISGVGQGSISKIERGGQDTSAYDIDLSIALDVNSLWLKKGIGERDKKNSSEKVSHPIWDNKDDISGLQDLMNMATPRSKVAIEKFIAAVKEKRMTDDDWEHLAAIVQRFKKPR